MKAVLTADIIASRKHGSEWLPALKELLDDFGKTPAVWEIYRGDSFQLLLDDAADSLNAAIKIKALLGRFHMDARIAIGIGETRNDLGKVTENNGSAFIRSGELFETLKPKKLKLAVATGNADTDRELNLLLRLLTALMENWLPQSAEFVSLALAGRKRSQEEMGKTLGIAQAAVSRRRKRAQFDLILEVTEYYRNAVSSLS